MQKLDFNVNNFSIEQIGLIGKLPEDKLQSYIDKIKEIQDTVNELFANSPENEQGLDIGQYQDYANTLSDVSASQAALLLSTQGLTNAQIAETLIAKEGSTTEAYKAMVEAGLLKSKQSLTNAELQNTIATKIGNEEDTKALMSHMGLSVAIEGEEVQTVQLTAKKLQQAVATGLVTEAQAQEIAMITGVTVAEETATASTTGLTGALRALWLTMKSNPLLMIATAAPIAITGISKLVDKLITTKKELEETRQKIRDLGGEARSSVDSINSNFESTKSTVDSVAERYATLAQEVQNLGKTGQNQGSLSNDEYAEFLDISNQLADLFPRLTNGYDDNGNAILDLSGDVDTITSSLYNLVDAEKAVASVEMQEKMGDIWAEYSQNANDYSKEYNRLDAERKGLSSFYDAMLGEDIDYLYTYYHDFEELFSKAGIDESVFNEVSTWSDFSEAQQNAIRDAYALIIKEYEKDINDYSNRIKSGNRDFSKYLITSLRGSDYYDELGDYKSIANSLLTDYGYDTELYNLRGKDNWDKALERIKDEIIKPFSSLSDEDKEAFQEYYNNLLSIDTDAALADNIPKIEEYITKLAELLDMDVNKLTVALGYDPESDRQAIETAKNRMGYHYGDKLTREETSQNKVIDAVADSLSDGDITLLAKIDIPEESKEWTKQEWLDFIDGLDKEAEGGITINPTESLDKIKSAFSGLESIYDDIRSSTTVAADSIESLNDAFGELDGGTALREFRDVLTTMPDDIDAQQEALNDLATAYIDNSDLVKNLTEENADYVKSELEKIGVINADEVVSSRLAAKNGEVGTSALSTAQRLKHETESLDERTFALYKAELANYGFSNSAISEIDALYRENAAAGKSQEEIYKLIQAKLNANTSTLKTDGDIKNLSDLVGALAVATREALTLASAKAQSSLASSIGQAGFVAAQYAPAQVQFGGSASNSGSSGGGSSSASEPKTETFDWIEVAIERLEEELDRLDKKGSDVYDLWTNRNTSLNEEIGKTREEIILQQKAYDGYMAKANSIGLSEEYKQKVQNGTIQIEEISDEALQQQIDDYQKWYEEASSVKDKIDDLTVSLSKLAEQKFDNIVSQFEEQENVFSSLNDQLDVGIDLAEAKGRLISKSYYEKMRQNENENNKLLVSQRDKMIRTLNDEVASGSVKEYSQTWYDLQSQISNVNKAIIKSNTSLQEFDNSIRELDLETFDLIQEKITTLADEIDFISDLIGDDSVTDGYAERGLTNEGLAQLGSYASKYNIYMARAQQYAEEIRKTEHEIAKDPANQDLIKQKQKLADAQQDVILSANEEKQAMLDLAKKGYDAVLETLQELIDKRREALNSEKELYEYQKTIAEKTKNIASVRKQLSVVENDDSEEAKKQIQQLRVELSEAEQDLRDTEYDKYISDQEDMMDKFYQDYSDKIDEKFEQLDILFQELIGIVNVNSQTISDTLASAAAEAGYKLSSELSGIWENTGTVVSDFSGQFDTYATTIQSVLSDIRLTIDSMLKISQSEADKTIPEIEDGNVSGANAGTGSTNRNPQTIPESSNTPDTNNNTDNAATQPTASVGTQIPNASGNWYYDSNGTAPTGSVNRWKPDYFMIDKIVEGRAYPYHIQAYIGGKAAGGNGWVKGSQIGYRTGLREAMYDHLAWTQENGGEIIRTSDGALLTPVSRGTTVFTRGMTNNLWNFAGNPKAFTADMVKLSQADLQGKSGGNVELNIENLTLPNVTKPEEFCDGLIHAMQNDNRVIKAMQSISVDSLVGKNSKRINRF